MQTYTHYKESGIDWIGQIPEHWEISKLGNILKPYSIKNKAHLPLLSITREKGVILRGDDPEESNHNFIPDDLSGYKHIKKGQFGMNKMKAWQGSYGYSNFEGIVSPAYYIFDISDKLSGDYFSKTIRSNAFIPFFIKASDGVRIGQWDLSKPRMKEIPFYIPPIHEQEAIAKFLGDKTAKIDALVQTKEQQIEKLKELRQAKIHQAVTKGLDAIAPTKYSGVAWIGEIPAHWEVKRLKHIGNAIIGLTYSPNDLCDSNQGTLVLRSSNLQNNGIEYNDNVFVKTKIPEKLKLILDDIVICSRNGSRELIGKCGIVKNEDLGNTFGAFTTVFRSNINKFLFQILSSGIFKSYSGMFLTSTINQLTISNLNSFEVPIPPIQEQEAIVAYLDEVTGKIDQAITQKQVQITKLKEYKQSLINDVVTGKVKVC